MTHRAGILSNIQISTNSRNFIDLFMKTKFLQRQLIFFS